LAPLLIASGKLSASATMSSHRSSLNLSRPLYFVRSRSFAIASCWTGAGFVMLLVLLFVAVLLLLRTFCIACVLVGLG
jgi:hypothetical protein